MATGNIASSVMQTLGGGSGIDIVKLARDLTDVEKLPAEEKITASQEAAEAKISALAVLKFNVQALIDEFNGLNDASELATPTATTSDSSVVSVVSTDGAAQSGLYDIHVDALATSSLPKHPREYRRDHFVQHHRLIPQRPRSNRRWWQWVWRVHLHH